MKTPFDLLKRPFTYQEYDSCCHYQYQLDCSVEKHRIKAQRLKDFKKKYKFLGWGARRATFLSKNKKWVYKLPLSDNGERDNRREALFYRGMGKEIILFRKDVARCRLGPNGILVMEKVNTNLEVKPTWAWRVDCEQVGKNREGKIVAYDYANEVPGINVDSL